MMDDCNFSGFSHRWEREGRSWESPVLIKQHGKQRNTQELNRSGYYFSNAGYLAVNTAQNSSGKMKVQLRITNRCDVGGKIAS